MLSLLELTARQMERGDYLSRLYLTARNQDDLNTVRATGVSLDTDMEQLRNLVRDPGQRSRAQNADSCVQELKKQFFAQLQQSTEADRMSMTRKVLECRDIISQMQLQEAILLKQRISEAQQITYQNLIAGVVFLLVSLTVVLILFGILLRDASKRIEMEKQISDTNDRLKVTVKTLESQATETNLLTSLRGELQLCATPAEGYRTAQRYVAQVLPAAKITLFTVNHSRQLLDLATTSDHQAQLMDGVPLDACCSLRGARARHRKPGNSEVDCAHFLGNPPQDYLCLPMAAHGQALGIFYIECPEKCDSDKLDAHLNILQRLAEMSSMWIAGLNLIERFESESIRDGLTNLFNRRFMEISLDRELRLAARRKGDLSLLMLDIDHFKRFNDTFGHEAGDQILRKVAEILRDAVRTEDIVCRYGGEEFLVILPGMGAEASFWRAEDIRQRVSKLRLDFPGEATKEVTISIGVSTFPQAGQAVEELVHSADRALYNAKESGRNRVQAASSPITV
ncbi:GGDEF domain-containing protein [Alloacidobacterium dinghuense]|uniref:diguanylate cyclase n=1 Tax=Alloacidobacterium dinghuense TaxID=2763107 RepID=A0A7G8BI47_9BACT|nr:GGDEF domain-containing protein [Alloacidobacterium dinghuense]QNI32217.1 GGDEF domain-containing protein [Alloacidobacterium dinghuense]